MIRPPQNADGDALLEQVLSNATDETSNELLQAFFAGYPVERLRLLLRSDDDDVVRAGVWIASELGVAAASVIDDLAPLLWHPLQYVRFWAVDAVLAAASVADGEVIARALGLIEDGEDAVRWKVLHLLARASSEQLAAALPFTSDANLARRLRWLAGEPLRIEDVAVRLDGDRLDRLFAVAAAARLRSGRKQALQRAMASSDDEVRTFAREELDVASK